MNQSVWIVNPYGSLPSEPWATYRSTMLAQSLSAHGYTVTQFISNIDHRSKTVRSASHQVIAVDARYSIEIIPSSTYSSHISIGRIRYERRFARNLLACVKGRERPDFIVLAEPALFYYGILLEPLLRNPRSALVLDLIDIWPELFELVIPRLLRRWSGVLLGPLYWWRRRLYRHAAGVVAVAADYRDIARGLVAGLDIPVEVVYWGYDDRRGEERPAHAPLEATLPRKEPGDVWALYAGTLGENYDIPAIVSVAAWLPGALRETVRLKFIVAGAGPLRQLCLDNASESFVFAGALGPADMAALFREADIALATYRGESTVAMPIKAFDYLRHGLPIVNSLGRDLGEMVRAHEVGINYDPGSPSSLAEAVERLSRDEALRRKMSDNASRLAPSFSASVQYRKFAEFLERLTAQRLRRTQ